MTAASEAVVFYLLGIITGLVFVFVMDFVYRWLDRGEA